MRKNAILFFCFAICSWLTAQQALNPPDITSKPAPAASATPLPAVAPPPPHTLLDGTPIRLRLTQTISSANAKTGQDIPFDVIEEIKVDGTVVIPKGATALGTVTNAMPKRRMGREGKLDIAINYARMADQEKCSLRASREGHGGGHVGAMTGAMVGTAIVFFPAAPLFLFMHGKDITIAQGTEITAFVEGDMHLDMAKFGVAPPIEATPSVAPESQASISIDSTPPGADIEVDSFFVGNTPSTIQLAPGEHNIVVRKKGFADWIRKMNVSGAGVHLNAELEAATTPAAASAAALPGTAK
jgi:hypothetical protein